MGHTKRKSPRRGSLQYHPHTRSRRSYPIVKNWATRPQAVPLGFAGYKAGMNHIIIIDNRPKSPTKGEEVRVPVTVIEIPPMKVAGVRVYGKGNYGLVALAEVWTDKLDKELVRRILVPKKITKTINDLKAMLPKIEDVRLLVYTQPYKLMFGKKRPDVFETAIGGKPNEQLEYASSVLGKELRMADVFKEGEFLDVHSITTGKGFQGVVKKFGVKTQRHKAEKGTREIATKGPITPCWVGWWIVQPGKMGFHTRTEYNKQLLKIGEVEKDNINPVSGFTEYGLVSGQYALIAGSVPAPKKRLVRFTHAIRPSRGAVTQAPAVSYISRTSQI